MAVEETHSSSPALSVNTEVTTPSPSNEYFDDVFGSGPPSPSFDHGNETPLDSTGSSAGAALTSHRESSDVARLRSIHTKAGYRDGLAAAKEASLQPGFDEGYTLGAALGLQAGLIVGVFESLRDTLDLGGNSEAQLKFEGLIVRCKDELQRQNLLADQYIDMNGLWAWQTPADATIHIVAASHPLVQVWRARMESVFTILDLSVEKLDTRWVDEDDADKPTPTKKKASDTNVIAPARQIFDF